MMELSLIKLAKEGKIEKTGAKPKLPIKVEGVTSDTLDVYRIPLDYLYYNDKNGRISTGIAEYEANIQPVPDFVDPSYNNLVAKIIENANPNALKRTEKSISESGQQVYGWVLDDGRVVDGNRRLTALRDLQLKTGQTMYFEAVVLPFSYENDSERVKIKKLELAIQMGVEEREAYDPVDLAIDIYQTTAGDNPLMTRADYARDARIRQKEVEEYYQAAIYIKEFLKFIGAPATSYDIIKDSQSWSLFLEMAKKLGKEFGDDVEAQVRKNETMQSYFGLILYQTHVGVTGNTARTHLRDYGKYIVSTASNSEFNEDIQDDVEDLSEAVQDAEVKDYADLTRVLTEENDTISEIGDCFNSYMVTAKSGESIEKFIKEIRKDVAFYKTLKDSNGLSGNLHYGSVSPSQLRELQKYMREISMDTKELFEIYGDEYEQTQDH